MPEELFAQLRTLLSWERFVGFAIMLLCLLVGVIVELFVARKRERLIAEGKLRDLAKEALFVFGRLPAESVTILSGLRILFLIVFWGVHRRARGHQRCEW